MIIIFRSSPISNWRYYSIHHQPHGCVSFLVILFVLGLSQFDRRCYFKVIPHGPFPFHIKSSLFDHRYYVIHQLIDFNLFVVFGFVLFISSLSVHLIRVVAVQYWFMASIQILSIQSDVLFVPSFSSSALIHSSLLFKSSPFDRRYYLFHQFISFNSSIASFLMIFISSLSAQRYYPISSCYIAFSHLSYS